MRPSPLPLGTLARVEMNAVTSLGCLMRQVQVRGDGLAFFGPDIDFGHAPLFSGRGIPISRYDWRSVKRHRIVAGLVAMAAVILLMTHTAPAPGLTATLPSERHQTPRLYRFR